MMKKVHKGRPTKLTAHRINSIKEQIRIRKRGPRSVDNKSKPHYFSSARVAAFFQASTKLPGCPSCFCQGEKWTRIRVHQHKPVTYFRKSSANAQLLQNATIDPNVGYPGVLRHPTQEIRIPFFISPLHTNNEPEINLNSSSSTSQTESPDSLKLSSNISILEE